jgi:hypothetical protein
LLFIPKLKTTIMYSMSNTIAKIKSASLTIAFVMSIPVSATSKAKQNFDYTSLDAETSRFVQQQTGEIRALMKRTAQDIFELGQKLINVKQILGHGRFGDWLKAEFGWGEWTARKFMQVAQEFASVEFTDLQIAPSALYLVAGSSTPDAAKAEVFARAASGEPITRKVAQAIKQKYTTPSTKPKQQPEPEAASRLPSPPTQTPLLEQSRSKPQIVAILPPKQPLVETKATNVLLPQSISTLQGIQPTLPVSVPDVPGDWWQLGRHLLYCGDPNSPQFIARVRQEVDLVQLLLAFPSSVDWQPAIRARARVIVDQFLPQGKKLDELDENLESNILFHSKLGDVVVSCFLPSPEIISIINRQSRRGLFAEPDSRRVAAIISDWKGAGLKVERIS